jgi:crotonobetainyl-CoA hydratase
LSIGLINRVVPDDTVWEAAMALAQRISTNAPLAVQASKRVATGQTDGTVPAETNDWLRSDKEIARVKASQDFGEGTSAFVEKRTPVWQAH